MTGANDQPVTEFTSHVKGKNATVSVYADRIEWAQKGLGKKAHEVIPMRAITSVSLTKAGLGFRAVQVITAGNTIDFRVDKRRADEVRQVLTDLLLGRHPAQNQDDD